MTETLNIKKINEKVYAIMPVFDDKNISDRNIFDRIDELKNLVLSAGAEFVGCGMQKIREINRSRRKRSLDDRMRLLSFPCSTT